MSKYLLVDGFNVIRRDAELSRVERADFMGAQEELARRLALYRRNTANAITLVYDGRHGQYPYRHKRLLQGIEVIYSAQGETADEVILDLVIKMKGHQAGCLVVTADRELARACQQAGVVVLLPEDLLRQTRSHLTVSRDPEVQHGKKEEMGWEGHTQKKGNPRRLPKQKRKPRGLW